MVRCLFVFCKIRFDETRAFCSHPNPGAGLTIELIGPRVTRKKSHSSSILFPLDLHALALRTYTSGHARRCSFFARIISSMCPPLFELVSDEAERDEFLYVNCTFIIYIIIYIRIDATSMRFLVVLKHLFCEMTRMSRQPNYLR